MQLNNVLLLNESEPVNIITGGDKISAIEKNSSAHNSIQFTNAVAFPGLINSHDHLDFNCFSPLTERKYMDYTEWGNDIHKNHKAVIDAILKIPGAYRAKWGMYKNLLAGVTAVVNHGAFLPIENPLIRVFQKMQHLHSIKFEKHWRWKLNNPIFISLNCAIHVGEGTNPVSVDEINELLKWNLLNRRLVGIHAVAMQPQQANKFKAIVWCPESNEVLLGKHAAIDHLSANTEIVFGTDSTLTGNWSIWHHLRLARKLQLANDAAIFDMLTTTAAKLWNMNSGSLQTGKDASIVIAKTKNGGSGWNEFYNLDPKDILLVMQQGKVRLLDETIRSQLENDGLDLTHFSSICMNDNKKWVEGDLPALATQIKTYYPAMQFPFSIDE